MATAYVLECSSAAPVGDLVQLTFRVEVVDAAAAFSAAYDAPVMLIGGETGDEIRAAMIDQLLPQSQGQFSQFNFTPADLVLVSVQRGA